jgi:nucleotide-binding universal stress UspA family protein
MAGEIVVGFDGREGARTALREATGLAKDLSAPLVVAFAYHVSPLGGELKDLHDALVERGQAVTGEALDAAREQGVDARAEVVHGDRRRRWSHSPSSSARG